MKIQKDENANRDEDANKDEDAGFELFVFFIFMGFDNLIFSTISTLILPFFFFFFFCLLPITQIA